ncbi:hypothetical protein [Nocardioides antri]|uniref:Uncharacterized protein n=1 Tax=Nocardioides antri TaxID=2607659 RepID=A0A5B1M8A5_9ACTN|nr:hypothetical protein [Nocardioides antri]KAA1428758.1 hypothetical protein F0U47_00615 [Nocardioides antri]
MSESLTLAADDVAPGHRPLVGHWPGLLGLAAATFQLLTGVSTESVAITVTVAASCYLAAAALGQPWIAWASILGASLVVTASEVAGFTWWQGLAALGVILVVIGLVRRAPAPAITAQGIQMVGFGGCAVLALFISPNLGMALAGIALAGHAAWDYVHWRRNDVVPRSMAEFCILLDVPFGVAAIVLAIVG